MHNCNGLSSFMGSAHLIIADVGKPVDEVFPPESKAKEAA